MKRSASRASLTSYAPSRRGVPPSALPAPLPPLALPAPGGSENDGADGAVVPIPRPLPLPDAGVVSSRAIELYQTAPLAVQPYRRRPVGARDTGERWVVQGKRKRLHVSEPLRELLEAAADVGGYKRPRLGDVPAGALALAPTRVPLDHGNPTPSQVPVSQQMALVPSTGSLALKRKLGGDDLEPTVQLMKRPRMDTGSVPLALDGLPSGARGKVRRTRRKGPVDVHMVDVSVPAGAVVRRAGARRGRVARRRRRGGRRAAGARVAATLARDSRGRFLPRGSSGTRRSTPTGSASRRARAAVRYHPSITMPAGWEGGPLATPASVARAVRPVVRYHPTIAQ